MKIFYIFIFTLLSIVFSTAQSAPVCKPPRDKNGHILRSKVQVGAFRKTHACPGTGKLTGTCTGYVVDHIKPLCKCGADKPSNMQWQTLAAAKAKDKLECKKGAL